MRLWFGVVNCPVVYTPVRMSFISRDVLGIFISVRRITLRKSGTLHISSIDRQSEKSTNSVVSNGAGGVSKSPWENETRIAPPRLMPRRSESSVLLVTTTGGLDIVE